MSFHKKPNRLFFLIALQILNDQVWGMQIGGGRREVEGSNTPVIEYSIPTASASAACAQPWCGLLRPLLLSGEGNQY